jgi:hypothetical protein
MPRLKRDLLPFEFKVKQGLERPEAFDEPPNNLRCTRAIFHLSEN